MKLLSVALLPLLPATTKAASRLAKRGLQQTDIPASSFYNLSTCEWGTECDPRDPYGSFLCPESGVTCSPLSNFSASLFLKALPNHCGAFLDPLEACSNDYSLRSTAADVWALCTTKLFGDMWRNASDDHGGPIAYDIRAENFGRARMVQKVDDGSCNKTNPDFFEILRTACADQLSALEDYSLNDTLGFDNEKSNKLNAAVLRCQAEAAIHYTRCTQWPSGDTTACVEAATNRLSWTDPSLITDNGKEKCPSVSEFLKHLILYNVVAFVVFAVLASRRLLQCIFLRRRASVKDRSIEVNYWTWTLSIAYHVGCTVGTAILTLGNGRNAGALPPDSTLRLDVGIWAMVEIWALRPRAAAPLALLGLVHRGYTGKALRAMFVNMLMCFVGIVWSGNLAFAPRGLGPVPDGWTIMTKGGLLTVIAQGIFIVMFLGMCCTPRKAVAGVRARYRERHPELSRRCGITRSEWGNIDWAVYLVMLFLSLWLYISSWMMWVGFLKVYGPLYCPPSLKEVDLMWCLGSVAAEGLGLGLDFFARSTPNLDTVPLSNPKTGTGQDYIPQDTLPPLSRNGGQSAQPWTAPSSPSTNLGYPGTIWPQYPQPQYSIPTGPQGNAGYHWNAPIGYSQGSHHTP